MANSLINSELHSPTNNDLRSTMKLPNLADLLKDENENLREAKQRGQKKQRQANSPLKYKHNRNKKTPNIEFE